MSAKVKLKVTRDCLVRISPFFTASLIGGDEQSQRF